MIKMFSKKYKKILFVEGMHCEHCAMTVENALKELGDLKIKVNLRKKQVEITSKEYLDNQLISKVFSNLEFNLKEIKDI